MTQPEHNSTHVLNIISSPIITHIFDKMPTTRGWCDRKEWLFSNSVIITTFQLK